MAERVSSQAKARHMGCLSRAAAMLQLLQADKVLSVDGHMGHGVSDYLHPRTGCELQLQGGDQVRRDRLVFTHCTCIYTSGLFGRVASQRHHPFLPSARPRLYQLSVHASLVQAAIRCLGANVLLCSHSAACQPTGCRWIHRVPEPRKNDRRMRRYNRRRCNETKRRCVPPYVNAVFVHCGFVLHSARKARLHRGLDTHTLQKYGMAKQCRSGRRTEGSLG